MKMNITILGTGAFGLALGNLLHDKSKGKITLWTTFEEEYLEITSNNTHDKVLTGIKLASDLKVTMSLTEALKNPDLVIVAIPCNYVREVLIKLKDYLNHDSHVILVSKGLEKNTNYLMHEIYQDLNLKGHVSYLAGPTFAKELIVNSHCGLTLATKDEVTKNIVLDLFKETNVEIEITEDIIGLELYGVIKNILAILMGSINSKYQKDSTNAYYLTKIYNYAVLLVNSLGGSKETATCYGALGDILLTCNSKNSRNYTYGALLYLNKEEAKEYLDHFTVEGVVALSALQERISKINNMNPNIIAVLSKMTNYFNGRDSLDKVIELF